MNSKFKGNIYHFSQVNFAFNSNKIEGGKLSEDETEEMFLTNSFVPKGDNGIKLDDLISFILFDYCLNAIAETLTKEILVMKKIERFKRI